MPTLTFKGKTFVSNHHLAVKYHQLIPNEAASLTDKVSLNDNLIVHGDNLIALKALLPNYAGRVKCIYIDPPYNTGNEGWRYNDNVNSPMMHEWLKSNQPIDREDLTRHDKWLCMMTPRLSLLKELLSDDGVIFISIDDNEVQHLRMLMDEVFGEGNWLGTVIWKKKTNGNNMGYIPPVHDYIVVYAKRIEQVKLNELPQDEAYIATNYSNPDNDPLGDWTTTDMAANHKGPYFGITNPKTGQVFFPPKGRYWVFNEQEVAKRISEGRIIFGRKGVTAPVQKKYKSEMSLAQKSESLWDDVGYNSEGTEEIADIFGPKEFENPKPTSLLKRILKIGMGKDSIVLDSFAGSGTTGQAVLELNKEDGGNRRFILVEMEDYADSLTAERLRRVIKGVPTAKDAKLRAGLGGSFSFFELGDPVEIDGVLSGDALPAYSDLARYLFYTATGDEFKPEQVDESSHFIGESKDYRVYLFYKPDRDYLRSTALTLDLIESLLDNRSKTRLVFAPARFVDQDYLDYHRVKYVQLPFEIYRFHA